MTLNDVTTAMQLYAAQRNQPGLTQMQSWYNGKNVFGYSRDDNNQPVPPCTEAYVHAYPGILDGQLVMFVISGNKDVPNNPSILSDIQICPVVWNDPRPSDSQNAIPAGAALEMVGNWIDDSQSWINANISTIFQGMAIPQVDTSFGNQHHAYLALKASTGAPGGYVADMVVQDEASGVIQYFDTGQPVPPYPPAVGGEAAFYLLGLIS